MRKKATQRATKEILSFYRFTFFLIFYFSTKVCLFSHIFPIFIFDHQIVKNNKIRNINFNKSLFYPELCKHNLIF